ncbi:MAG: hypothetical protein ABI594_20265 [Ginsengibacter sp.]
MEKEILICLLALKQNLTNFSFIRNTMKKLFTLFVLYCIASGSAFGQQKTTPAPIKATEKLSTPTIINTQSAAATPDAPQNLPVTYTFTGDGNWNVPGNWTNNVVPPQPTNLGSEIIINNISGGQCVLNIPYTVTPGTSFTILTGKTLVVNSLTVN